MNNGHRGGGKPSGAGACSKKIMVLRRPGWCGVRSEEAELGGVCMVIKAKITQRSEEKALKRNTMWREGSQIAVQWSG